MSHRFVLQRLAHGGRLASPVVGFCDSSHTEGAISNLLDAVHGRSGVAAPDLGRKLAFEVGPRFSGSA